MKTRVSMVLAAALAAGCAGTNPFPSVDEGAEAKANRLSIRSPFPSLEERLRQIEREALERQLERQKAIADRILHVSGQRPILAVLDTYHGTGEAQTFFNNSFLAEGWARQGKKHVLLEVNTIHNPVFRDLFERKIADEEFIAMVKRGYSNLTDWASLQRSFRSPKDKDPAVEFAEGIIHLRNAGIRVHGVDQPLDKSAFTPKEWDVIVAINEGETLGLNRDAIKSRIPHPELANDDAIRRLKEKRIRVRLSDDPEIIERAKKIAGTDPFVIVYGVGHFENLHDMDELLGGSKEVATLALYPFESVRRIDEKRRPPLDPPDFVLSIGDAVLKRRSAEGSHPALP